MHAVFWGSKTLGVKFLGSQATKLRMLPVMSPNPSSVGTRRRVLTWLIGLVATFALALATASVVTSPGSTDLDLKLTTPTTALP